jgi:hypothetical protein
MTSAMTTTASDEPGRGRQAPREPAAIQATLATVPTKPTAAMLAAGARAGSVSVEIAWRVFQAMVQAAR